MKKSFAPIVITLSFTLLASCGKDSGGKGRSQSLGPAIQEQEAEGSYRAILRPINNSLSGYLPTGGAEFEISADRVSIKTYLDDDARVSHIQSVHVGSRCPGPSDDANGDGVVDYQEAINVVGDVLIPLDADVNSLADGQGIYPVGGGFTYTEKASLSNLESDVSTRTNQSLNLGGRAILIHGVASGTPMPETASTKDVLPKQASVPIACGIISRR